MRQKILKVTTDFAAYLLAGHFMDFTAAKNEGVVEVKNDSGKVVAKVSENEITIFDRSSQDALTQMATQFETNHLNWWERWILGGVHITYQFPAF
ncbi:MAG: hypothetical protein HYV90_06025 [Candidatus Woesebacteria bacterium]|nr:MAG: hypothetical protein HYV90_06025 [Candidatus Woesebacteria bacterium]